MRKILDSCRLKVKVALTFSISAFSCYPQNRVHSTWNHFVVTYDGTAYAYFINGEEEARHQAVNPPVHPKTPSTFGSAVWANYQTNLTGCMDDVCKSFTVYIAMRLYCHSFILPFVYNTITSYISIMLYIIRLSFQFTILNSYLHTYITVLY